MLTEAEFEELVALSIPNENSASRFYRHDRAQRAEIERLKTELATATDRADKIEGELEAERLLERWTAIDKMRMDIASGKLDLLFRGPFTQILSELLVSWFVRGTDAINFVTWQIDHEATGRLEFVCQRVDGKTPSDLRRDAEAQRDAAIARAEKAEAERDSLRNRLKPSLEYVEGTACGYGDDEIDRLTEQIQELKLAILAALTKAGLAMLEENPITPWEVNAAIARLARERDSERARAEKYLAAMTALVETDGTDAEWLAPLAAIRALVEEARRG